MCVYRLVVGLIDLLSYRCGCVRCWAFLLQCSLQLRCQMSSSLLIIRSYVYVVDVCDCLWVDVQLLVMVWQCQGFHSQYFRCQVEPPCTLGSGLNPEASGAWLMPWYSWGSWLNLGPCVYLGGGDLVGRGVSGMPIPLDPVQSTSPVVLPIGWCCLGIGLCD